MAQTNLFKRLRVLFASLFLVAATLLFLDFTGTIHNYLGWVAKVQLVPAILATHLIVVIALCAITLIFGRLYCSVICPLGLFQDATSRLASLTNKKRKFSYAPAKNILRIVIFALFVVVIILGATAIAALIDPYAAFGRIVSSLVAPLYKLGNNLLADLAERADSYAFYSVEVITSSIASLVVAIVTLALVGTLAWRNGRTYCNTICPVGTLLGFLSKFSLLKIRVDNSKCNGCRKCVRTCKSVCITPEDRSIDYSRCVTCFNCIDSCNQGAISYTMRRKKSSSTESAKHVDNSKRNMLAVSSALLATTALKAEGKLVDGGVALIEGKAIPTRNNIIVPPGAQGVKNFTQKCVGCQLCVTVCPNNVLRPSTSLSRFMQPEASFEVGFCRPECTKCSEVCPAGAILPIDKATKSSTKIGCATLIRENCVIATDNVDCGSCAAHCPSGAISMIEPADAETYHGRKIPVVDQTRCIGCGACENLCPARPFSAIYVEGSPLHSQI